MTRQGWAAERGDDHLATIGVGLIIAGVLVTAGNSAIAALVCLLAGNGWRWTPIGDSARAIARLTQDPGHPAAAFPEPVAAGVPGPWLFWAVYAVAVGLLLAAGTVGLWWWSGRRAGGPAQRAAWGTARHERRIAVPADPQRRPYRLVAGRGTRTRRLLGGDDCISAVVFGPNGSGKTSGLVVPNVLEWAGPVVMTTTKSQDATLILARRRCLGPVWVVAPAGGAGLDTTGWSPVDYCVDEETADRMAEWLCEASGITADTRSRAWVLQARKLVKPILLAAAVSGGGVEALSRWIYEGRAAVEEVTAVLTAGGFPAACREYASTWSIHEEGVGSVLFTAYGLADAYSRPSVLAAARSGGFTVADLFGARPATLVVVAPESEADRFAPLVTALIASVVHEAEARAAAAGRPLEPRLLLALDEAANVFRFPRLPQLLTTARGNGIQLLLAYHDLGQLEHVTGSKQIARTVVSNAKLRILLPGVGDLDTLRYFSDLFGRTRITQTSQTRGWRGDRSTSTSESAEDLAPIHLLRQLGEGEAVVQYQNLPPMRIRLRLAYRDRALRRLAVEPVAS